MYFGQDEDLKLTTELSEKVQYSHHQTLKNGLNEAKLLMWINKLYFRDKTLCRSSNQDFCMKVIRIFNAQPVKYPTLRACWSVNKYDDHIFLMFIS